MAATANAWKDCAEPTHRFKHILPALEERGVSRADIDTIMIENPRRYVAGDEAPR